MSTSFRHHKTALAVSAALASLLLTSGCSSVGSALSSDKVDYRSSGSKSVVLDVPPDLSQLPGQSRYGQVQTGSVTASSLNQQQAQSVITGGETIAPTELGGVRLVREGQQRWLAVNQAPDQIWEQVRNFWIEQGFELSTERADIGVIETNWVENRHRVSGEGGVRQLIGRVIDMLHDSGERDSYRIRIERTAEGSEIYVNHRGLTEVYVDNRREQTTWRARPSDPSLEAEMLSRLMVTLGASKEAAAAAKAEAAKVPTEAAPANDIAHLSADGTAIALDTDYDTAWRRIGLALDRSAFTVENRDRKLGIYEVRLAASEQEAEKPGFLRRLFGASQNTEALQRYVVKLAPEGASRTQVEVQDTQGQRATTPTAKRVAKLLADELN